MLTAQADAWNGLDDAAARLRAETSYDDANNGES